MSEMTRPVILCETTGACTCGAPATTPRGMHHDYCGVRTPPAPTTDPRAEEARAATRCDMRHGEQNVPNEQEEAS